jgi:hypothetical protein
VVSIVLRRYSFAFSCDDDDDDADGDDGDDYDDGYDDYAADFLPKL